MHVLVLKLDILNLSYAPLKRQCTLTLFINYFIRLQPLGIVEDELLSSELCLGILPGELNAKHLTIV